LFYHISGAVTDILPSLAVIDCGGVGYALNVSAATLSRLKKGDTAKLYTYCNIREDLFDIYGFFTLGEKRCFEMLIGVSGVGPKAALAILSALSPEELALAIIGGDEKKLTAAAGVGKKLAQRVILELKDKLAKEAGFEGFGIPSGGSAPPFGAGGKLSDAQSALTVLGYTPSEAAAALKDIDEGETLENIIKLALKKMIK